MKLGLKIITLICIVFEILLLPYIAETGHLNPIFYVYNIFAVFVTCIFFHKLIRNCPSKQWLLLVARIISIVCIFHAVLRNYLALSSFIPVVPIDSILTFLILVAWMLFAINQYIQAGDRTTRVLCVVTLICIIGMYVRFFELFFSFPVILGYYVVILINNQFYIPLIDIATIVCLAILILRTPKYHIKQSKELADTIII